MTTYETPLVAHLQGLTPHQKHLLITNVYWRRPLVGVVRSLPKLAARHGEVV